MSRTPSVSFAPVHAPAKLLGLRDALRWLGIALLVVASLVVIGAFLLMPVVPAVPAAGA
ncbi:hypothetical protein [Acidovorax carolinensis]|uniref:hypothetical protein n=1 Tax=Acidovorax carolinensis TaxID=553814 RepID=UPI0012FF995D|nr:hypothetical protein [Acidovorax carolinensis]